MNTLAFVDVSCPNSYSAPKQDLSMVTREDVREMDASLTDYDPTELEYTTDAENLDLAVTSPDGNSWYFRECNGSSHPPLDAGETRIYVDTDRRVTVSIDEWNGEEYVEHDVEYTLVECDSSEV